jgi:hypothetical protein
MSGIALRGIPPPSSEILMVISSYLRLDEYGKSGNPKGAWDFSWKVDSATRPIWQFEGEISERTHEFGQEA